METTNGRRGMRVLSMGILAVATALVVAVTSSASSSSPSTTAAPSGGPAAEQSFAPVAEPDASPRDRDGDGRPDCPEHRGGEDGSGSTTPDATSSSSGQSGSEV